jgi:hypothetical protein
MKSHLFSAVVVGTLFVASPAFAQSTAKSSSSSTGAITPGASVAATTHATKGVVKSVNASALVLSHAKGKTKDRTFVLNATTARQGDIAAGATVDVRYRMEGANRVATAVAVHQTKSPAAAKSKTTK